MFHFLHQVIDWIGANWSAGSSGLGSTGSQDILHLLVGHVLVCVYSLAIALVISLPLSLWLGHTGKGGFLAINVTNVGRALPSIAVLILAAQTSLGVGIKAVIVALVLLSIPPIVTNTYTAIREVDPDAKDAAKGMGMTGFQVLRQVEIPSGMPLIAAGIKTAAVQAVATAALAGYVGYNCLGILINQGLSLGPSLINASVTHGPTGHVELFAGSILVIGLALVTEYGLTGLQRIVTPAGILVAQGARPRRRRPWERPEPDLVAIP
jgi:osmoprotectant transport system permease protein